MELRLDPSSDTPLYTQIVEQVRRLVARGALRAGDRLPTVRELAASCRVNRNTAARAVQVLESEGVVRTRVGRGTFVADGAAAASATLHETALDRLLEQAAREASALGLDPEEAARRLRAKMKTVPEGRRGGKP